MQLTPEPLDLGVSWSTTDGRECADVLLFPATNKLGRAQLQRVFGEQLHLDSPQYAVRMPSQMAAAYQTLASHTFPHEFLSQWLIVNQLVIRDTYRQRIASVSLGTSLDEIYDDRALCQRLDTAEDRQKFHAHRMRFIRSMRAAQSPKKREDYHTSSIHHLAPRSNTRLAKNLAEVWQQPVDLESPTNKYYLERGQHDAWHTFFYTLPPHKQLQLLVRMYERVLHPSAYHELYAVATRKPHRFYDRDALIARA